MLAIATILPILLHRRVGAQRLPQTIFQTARIILRLRHQAKRQVLSRKGCRKIPLEGSDLKRNSACITTKISTVLSATNAHTPTGLKN